MWSKLTLLNLAALTIVFFALLTLPVAISHLGDSGIMNHNRRTRNMGAVTHN